MINSYFRSVFFNSFLGGEHGKSVMSAHSFFYANAFTHSNCDVYWAAGTAEALLGVYYSSTSDDLDAKSTATWSREIISVMNN